MPVSPSERPTVMEGLSQDGETGDEQGKKDMEGGNEKMRRPRTSLPRRVARRTRAKKEGPR